MTFPVDPSNAKTHTMIRIIANLRIRFSPLGKILIYEMNLGFQATQSFSISPFTQAPTTVT